MPTAKYVYQDDDTMMTDPDETRLDSQNEMEAMPTKLDPLSTPLPLRGGGTHHTNSTAILSPSRTNRHKFSTDSDDDDEEMMSERQFLEGLARRRREQQERIQSQRTSISFVRDRQNEENADYPNLGSVNHNNSGESLLNASRHEESLCTQDTVPMNNRTVDMARDTTLLGDTTAEEVGMDFEEQSWEKEVKLDAIMGQREGDNHAKTKVDQRSTMQKCPKTPKPFTKLHNRGWEIKALYSSLNDLLSRTSDSACSNVARQRYFDAVSRSLARLAVVSRSDEAVKGDGDIPSPRSLPAFMSVMNVEGWKRSGDVFEGRSVHGRSGRTVFLDSEEGDLEKLMTSVIKVAGDVCAEQDSTVEAALEFLATAFACLECDYVYSMLTLSVGADGMTLFDILLDLTPNEKRSDNISSTLAFLALSRALEAAVFVARYATSLDPAGCCAAYASPHSFISNGVDYGIDERGVGFLSALGKGLGLRLEDDQGLSLSRLNDVARYAFDSVIDFNPMLSDGSLSFYDHSIEGRVNDTRGGRNESLCIDVDVGNVDGFQCRNPSVVKDRMYSAHVEFLSSMIQMGIISEWLCTSNSEKPVLIDTLCQKLFLVIETRSRLQRSTRTTNDSPGDSEAVCSASLSLLLLSLPKHCGESSSNSISFRQMGDSTGTIRDIFESPFVKRLVEVGLSSGCDTSVRIESISRTRRHALNSILYVISDLLMAGGASLIAETFLEKLNIFLARAIAQICQMNQQSNDENCASIDAALLLITHLHTGCPVVVRRALQQIFNQTSSDDQKVENGIDANIFLGNLIQLCAHVSTKLQLNLEFFSSFSNSLYLVFVSVIFLYINMFISFIPLIAQR